MKKLFQFLTIGALAISASCLARRPIVLVHGILADAQSMQPTEEYIKKYLPGTYVKSVEIGNGEVTSFWSMHRQVKYLVKELQSDPKLKNGFDMIAHSQGGLVSRYFIQHVNKPRVHTYITWGSPHQGVLGTPGTFDNRFTWMNWFEWKAHNLLYSSFFQNYVSFAGYWHDTAHYDLYIKQCKFLPYLNNEIKHNLSQLYKENLLSLENFVMVNSSREDIIEPRISCHFGFYAKGSKSKLEKLHNSDIYQQDVLGLKKLDETQRLHMLWANCTHTGYQEDEHNFVHNTLPFLQS